MSTCKRTDQPYKPEDKLLSYPNGNSTQGSTGVKEFSPTNFYPLCESVSDAIFILDGDKVIDCNNKTLEMFACSRDEIVMTSGKAGGHDYVDISDRKKSEEYLKASEERYRTILENIEDAYYEVDLQGELTFFNKSLCKISGFAREELMGTNVRQYVDEPAVEKIFNVGKKVYQTGLPEKYSDFEIICKDGLKKHIEISLSLMRNLSGNPIGFCGIARDIDERKKVEATIFHMAYHDMLTGLPNRLLFNDRLNMTMSAAQRNNNKFAVMMLYLDRFKLVNDLLGHDAGDLLLKNAGNRLCGHLRKSDTVARMGGDEFMLLLPEIPQKQDAEVIAGKIVESFHRVFFLKNKELKITVSIGIAIYPEDGVDFDTLKKNADIAMYKVKEKGRDNFQCYDSILK